MISANNNQTNLERMKELIRILNEADIAYYRDDNPIMTDLMYMSMVTWKDVVAAVLEECSSAVPLSYLYEQIESHEKTKSNKWWKEKIRQTLQCNPAHFAHTDKGMWCLKTKTA